MKNRIRHAFEESNCIYKTIWMYGEEMGYKLKTGNLIINKERILP
jgi:hypothetical protein